MSDIDGSVLEQVIGACRDAVLVVNLDHPEWPVLLTNPAADDLTGEAASGRSVPDVVEALLGRDLALDVSETLRNRVATSYPVEIRGTEYLLIACPLPQPGEERAGHAAVFLRATTARGGTARDAQQALLNAKRHIRDLTRDDPVTGLLNERSFREMLDHDWAVAARERSTLALVVFTLDDFDAYVEVFGRHAADSCLRRVGQAVRRCLRRASDVVGRFDGARLVVLSHAAEEQAVASFAAQIAGTVRELGLHHPRSSVARFVTVTPCVLSAEPAEEESAAAFIDRLLAAADAD